MVRARGFSLMETMVVMSIIAIVLVVSVPLASGWMASSRLGLAESQMLQAYARTKSLALRNPEAMRGGEVAATLQIDASGTLTVNQPNGLLNWQVTPGEGISLFLAASATATVPGCSNRITLDSSSLPLSACTVYILSVEGAQRVSGTLY